MRKPGASRALSLLIILSLSGCQISAYRPLPVDQSQSQEPFKIKLSSPLSFFFYTGASKAYDPRTGALPIEFEVLGRVFATFAKPNMSQTPVDQGLYVVAYKTKKSRSSASQVFCWLSAVTLNVIPCYSGNSGYSVVFNLYHDGKQEQTYRYEVIEKEFVWIGVLPFSWANALTTSYEEAFETTTWQFVQDAKKDGYF